MTLHRTSVLAILIAAPLVAQCSNLSGVSFASYGGCTLAFSGSYDPVGCTVSFTLTQPPPILGGSTYLVGQVLVFGSSPVQVAIPILTCDLLVSPDTILEFNLTGGGTFVFQVPSAPLAGTTLYVQGVNVFYVAIGWGSVFYEASNALQVSAF